jgi:hypothetical protein
MLRDLINYIENQTIEFVIIVSISLLTFLLMKLAYQKIKDEQDDDHYDDNDKLYYK